MKEIMEEEVEQIAKPDLVRRISKKVDRKYSHEEIFEVLNAALDCMVDRDVFNYDDGAPSFSEYTKFMEACSILLYSKN